MSQREHWKKKRPAVAINERKSWLNMVTAERGDNDRRDVSQPDTSPRKRLDNSR